jgi:hypothetical protein
LITRARISMTGTLPAARPNAGEDLK